MYFETKIWKAKREWEREIFHMPVYSWNSHKQVEARSQWFPSVSPMWVVGAHALGPCSIAFPMEVEHQQEVEQFGSGIESPMGCWCHSLTHCAMPLTPKNLLWLSQTHKKIPKLWSAAPEHLSGNCESCRSMECHSFPARPFPHWQMEVMEIQQPFSKLPVPYHAPHVCYKCPQAETWGETNQRLHIFKIDDIRCFHVVDPHRYMGT